MEELLNKYKHAWKTSKQLENQNLNEDQIKSYLHKQSRGISQLFKRGLQTDIFLKSLTSISFIIVMYLLPKHTSNILTASLGFLICTAGIIFQLKHLKLINQKQASSKNIRADIESKLKFYYSRYIKSIYVSSISSPLIILSGMTFHFQFKYGDIKPLELDDYIVLGSIFLLSFVIGIFAYLKQFSFHIKQLEECLAEIDKNAINMQSIQKRKNARLKNIIIFLLAAIVGTSLLIYLLLI